MQTKVQVLKTNNTNINIFLHSILFINLEAEKKISTPVENNKKNRGKYLHQRLEN